MTRFTRSWGIIKSITQEQNNAFEIVSYLQDHFLLFKETYPHKKKPSTEYFSYNHKADSPEMGLNPYSGRLKGRQFFRTVAD